MIYTDAQLCEKIAEMMVSFENEVVEFPHLTIKTVLLNRIRKVQTKTPFLLLLTVGKRG